MLREEPNEMHRKERDQRLRGRLMRAERQDQHHAALLDPRHEIPELEPVVELGEEPPDQLRADLLVGGVHKA